MCVRGRGEGYDLITIGSAAGVVGVCVFGNQRMDLVVGLLLLCVYYWYFYDDMATLVGWFQGAVVLCRFVKRAIKSSQFSRILMR